MKTPRVAVALAMAGVALTLGACKSGESPKTGDSKAADNDAAAEKAAANEGAEKAAESTATADDGAPSLDELRQERTVREQARQTLIQHFTKLGDEAFAASRFEDAEKHYGDVLDLDSSNEHARRRMQQIGAVLGKRGLTAAEAAEAAGNTRQVQIQQAKAEVANLVSQAQAKEATGDLNGAVALYERALVIVQLYPGTVDFEPTADGLRSMLSSAKQNASDAADAARRRELAEAREQARLEAARQRAAQQSRVDNLLRQANQAMERGSYQLAENLAREILVADPTSAPAKRLAAIARDARFAEAEERIQKSLLDEWKHIFAELREATVPQVEDYTFPDTWRDLQAKRTPPTLSSAAKMVEDPKTREVKNRLGAARTTVNFQEASIDEAVEYLGRISGTNIVVLPDAREGRSDEELSVDLKLDSAESVDRILDLITTFRGLAWNVADGVVQITTPEAARGESIVQLYDVKDLATPINNFPGEEVNLDPTGEAFFDEEVPEPMPEFLLESIRELIEQNVDTTVWEEGGSIEGLEPGTLVVKAPPETQGKIQNLLDGLRGAGGLQVSIETRFITVADNFLQEVGVDMRGLGDDTGGISVPVTFDDLFFGSAGAPEGIGRGNDVGIYYSLNSDGDIRGRFENVFDLALGREGVLTNLGGLSFQGTLIDDTQLEVILRAVEKSDRSTEVIAPRLTAYNGQRANVTVLNQLSYISDFDVEIAQASQIGDPIVQTLRDGVILDLRPVITADRRFITMELRPTVAILQRPIATFQTTLANGPPVTIQLPELEIQRVRTTVTMPDGGTLLLGGMKFFLEQRQDSSTPWLSDIPIVSFFVSRKGTFLEKRNMLVLIRARILRPEENEPGAAVSR
jgi:type II secretory pathway component GspD/PulD (secretin)